MRASSLSCVGLLLLVAPTVCSEEDEDLEEDYEDDFRFGILVDGTSLIKNKPKCLRHSECDPLHFCHYETCTPRVVAELGRCPAHGGNTYCVPFGKNTTAPGVPPWLAVIGVHNVCASLKDSGSSDLDDGHCGSLPWDSSLPPKAPRRQLCRYHTHCDVTSHFCPEDSERTGLTWESTCKERWVMELQACPDNPYPAKMDRPNKVEPGQPMHSLPFWPGSVSNEPGVVRVIVDNGHFGMELCGSAKNVKDQCETQEVPDGGIQHDPCPNAEGVVEILEASPYLENPVEHMPPGLLINPWATPIVPTDTPDGSPENPYTFFLPKDSHEFCCPGCGYWCCIASMSAAHLGEQGWRRVYKKQQATMVLAEIRSSKVRPQNRVIQETTNTPDFALKSGLFLLAWQNFTGELEKKLQGKKQGIQELKENVNEFYTLYKWLPRSYLLNDKVHKAVLRDSLACEGANTEWVIKSNSHHGEGIQKPLTLDTIRRLSLHQKENELDCGKNSPAAKKAKKRDGKFVKKHEAVLQEWMRSVQIPLKSRHAQGGQTTFQLMFRVFFATMWPYRPPDGSDKDAKLEIWYWPQTLHHLYAHNLSHYDPIYYLSGKELQERIQKYKTEPNSLKDMPDLIKWEQEVAWPQALEALRKNVEWSVELQHVYESETQGRYQLGGIDFIVTENWGVRILEISMDPLHETVPSIVPWHQTIAKRSADLFLHLGGFSNYLTKKQPHGAAPVPWKWDDPPEWQLLMRHSVTVRPGDPDDMPVDDDEEDEYRTDGQDFPEKTFKENPEEVIPLEEGEPDPELYSGSEKEAQVLVRSVSPRVVTLRNFLSKEEFGALRRLGYAFKGESEEDYTGRHFEMPYAMGRSRDQFRGSPAATETDLGTVRQLVAKFDHIFLGNGRKNVMGGTLRMRRYNVGQGHPPHVDTYKIDEGQLVISIMMHLRAPMEGGATRFSETESGLDVFPETGDITVWWSCKSTGESDEYSEHAGQKVTQGVKWTSTYFAYTDAKEEVCNLPFWKSYFEKGEGYQGPWEGPVGSHPEL